MAVQLLNNMLMSSRIKHSSSWGSSMQLASHIVVGWVNGASNDGANSMHDQNKAGYLDATTGSGASITTFLSQQKENRYINQTLLK